MGFEKSMVEQCLVAAYYDKETALEYLMNGIPEEALSEMQSQTTNQVELTAEQAEIVQ